VALKRWKSFGRALAENVFFFGGRENYLKCKCWIISYICVMDFWTTIGVVSSVFGIFSFLKNDAVSLIPFLKKI